MGWLEGVLTGYANRHYEIEKQKREDAEKAAVRQSQVFETLLNSPYKDIKDYALAGMLDLGNPQRRKGGVAGWMGEVEQTPYLDMVRRAQNRINADPEYAKSDVYKPSYEMGDDDDSSPLTPPATGGAPSPSPSIPTPSGSVAPPAPGAPKAAQPSTSLTTGGPATPPTPPPPTASFMPGAGAPSTGRATASFMPSATAAAGAPGAPPAPPPMRVAFPVSAPPPPPVQAARGAQGPPRRTQLQLPGIVPTAGEAAAEVARARAAGADQGEQDSAIRVAEAQGLTRAEGLAMWAEWQMKSRSGAGAGANAPYGWRTMEYTDDQGVKHRILARTNRVSGVIEDIYGKPLPPNATAVTPGLYPSEMVARMLATGPLLSFNQSMTVARSLFPNASAEDILAVADQAYNKSREAAQAGVTPKPPDGGPSTTPPPGGGSSTPPSTSPSSDAPVVDPAPGGVAPPTPPFPTTPVASHGPGGAIKQGLIDAGRADLLPRTRDVGRPATQPERDRMTLVLQARQPLDALLQKDQNGQTLEDRIAAEPLSSQLRRKYTPDALEFTLTPEEKLYKTAMKRFSEARVRKVSGAQVRPDEFESDEMMFFAQPGNTPEQIKLKQRLREAEMDAAVFAAGPAYNGPFHHDYTPTDADAAWAILKDRLPDAMPPPATNRSIPRAAGGAGTTPMAPTPSHTPAAAPAAGAPATVPPPYKDAQGVWHIYR